MSSPRNLFARRPLALGFLPLVALGLGTTVEASVLTYTLSGATITGSYTLGSTTTNFTNAAVTYSATADSSAMVSGVPSNTAGLVNYLIVNSMTITIVDGSTTTKLLAGTRVVNHGSVSAPASMAVVSFADSATPTYSGIGFGYIDIVPNADNPTNSASTPYFGAAAAGLAAGGAVLTNLQTVGSFATLFLQTPGSLEVSSPGGGASGTLDLVSFAGSPTMTISAASAAVPLPGAAGLAACGLLAMARRRRR